MSLRCEDEEIQKIFDDYLRTEKEFEEEISKLRSKSKRKENSETSNLPLVEFPINSEESHRRNQKLLKDLELAKARLRTFAAYTPTDEELRQRASIYRSYLQTKLQNRKGYSPSEPRTESHTYLVGRKDQDQKITSGGCTAEKSR